MPEVLHWQRSSYSAGGGDTDCLETATAPTTPPPPRERRPRHDPLAHPHALLTAVKSRTRSIRPTD
ncbi:DUF397 domain-containing protein [Streptomyces bobili]|uniref:DUF397 domain-containing protein n=1 Tax=Streptomyces bobili TaxID=67280 RepID=UPI003419CB76